ncbi:hypothetical protein ALC62_04835 [Cyphomyrmex costatus]|uniref:Uncharacterized protein n=1 Tax=Cyphomyrmex costatus TaxID=456900 RepID=A0A195CTQ4_9HYME|nr:hypothetical protein ALC62_04835 [Cyphomyrmex costatus]
MKKLLTRWVPCLLTVDHKRDRVTISKHCGDKGDGHSFFWDARGIIYIDYGGGAEMKREFYLPLALFARPRLVSAHTSLEEMRIINHVVHFESKSRFSPPRNGLRAPRPAFLSLASGSSPMRDLVYARRGRERERERKEKKEELGPILYMYAECVLRHSQDRSLSQFCRWDTARVLFFSLSLSRLHTHV